jgi:cardiolipin synthase
LHRKIVAVDQKIAFVGGINIHDDTDMHGENWNRFDYAIRVEGPLAKEIHNSAAQVWARVAWTRLRQNWSRGSDRNVPPTEPVISKRLAFLVRDNIRHRRDIEDAYLQAIKLAQFEIILANAYFLPGLNFRHALLDAAKRGVRVVLLLQGRANHRLLQYASHALYGSFLDAGIEIFEYHTSMMHAKVAVIDEQWATVGSSNLDPFSLLLALEANVMVVDQNFAKELKQSLREAIRNGGAADFQEYLEYAVVQTASGKLAKLWAGFASWLDWRGTHRERSPKQKIQYRLRRPGVRDHEFLFQSRFTSAISHPWHQEYPLGATYDHWLNMTPHGWT